MTTGEAVLERPVTTLTEADQAWLSSFGVDPSWTQDPDLIAELNDTIAIGSLHIGENGNDQYRRQIILARKHFFDFVGVDEEALARFETMHPTYAPLHNFIGGQRLLTELGLDAAKIINSFPSTIGYAAESIRDKIDNLTELGLDAHKVIDSQPVCLSYATESVQASTENLTKLGLDATKVVNTYPPALGLATESVQASTENLTKLGLDATKVVNAFPQLIGLANESIQVKMENLTKLGLDATKVVNAFPRVFSLALEHVQTKVRMLERSARVLGWQFEARDIIEAYPTVLCFNRKKLRILRRIAAEHMTIASRGIEPKKLKSMLITPLEQYIMVVDQEDSDNREDAPSLRSKAQMLKILAPERKQQALEIAQSGTLGRIGTMYLDYRGISPVQEQAA